MAENYHQMEIDTSDASSSSFHDDRNEIQGESADISEGDAGESSTVDWKVISESLQPNSSKSNFKVPHELQQMVTRALLQCTASLLGSSSKQLEFTGEATITHDPKNPADPDPPTTWKETTYRKSLSRQNWRPQTLRTSAGEGSDSQEDFPMLQNAITEQRALRTKQLNWWRTKKARDLTNNRKAARMLPYMVHVDGTSKPGGTHRHKWKAAVRGLCGRLDPTIDNINHHPKHVVDSMWHALEKEWDFEGFAHKGREMFEKSATKFMKNRKMQLKNKCKQLKRGQKPNDVTDEHWKKIVAITNISLKQEASSSSIQAGVQRSKRLSEYEVVKEGTLKDKSAESGQLGEGSVPTQEEDVTAHIKHLKNELHMLENSTENLYDQEVTKVLPEVLHRKGSMSAVRRVCQASKENVAPPSPNSGAQSPSFSERNVKTTEPLQRGDKVKGKRKQALSAEKVTEEIRKSLTEVDKNKGEEMECGDVVWMTSSIPGEVTDIGKGVLMGFPGSKLARKVIPKGWCSVKIVSFTVTGASETCPVPCGWKDHLKYRTIAEAEGRIILWPKTLLRISND